MIVTETADRIDAQLVKLWKNNQSRNTTERDYIAIPYLPYSGATKPDYLVVIYRDMKRMR